MKIKTLPILSWLCLLCLVCACGGVSRQKVETPADVQAGAKAIEKGNRLYAQGCYRQAAPHFFRAHVAFTAADDQPGVALSLNNLGNVYQAEGDADNAIAFFDESLAVSESLGDRPGILRALSNKVAALIGADRLEQAETLIAETARRAGEPFLPLQINQGILLIKKKDYPRAQTVLEEALAGVARQDRASRAKIHFALGRLMRARGNPAGAIDHFQLALADDRAVGSYRGMAQDHAQLGDAYREKDGPARALAHYKQAVKLYALLGAGDRVPAVLAKLEQTADATGADIRITTHFVKTWLEDKGLKRPCR